MAIYAPVNFARMNDISNNSNRASAFWPILVGMVLVALILVQFNSIAALRSEVAGLKQQQNAASTKPTKPSGTALSSRAKRSAAPVVIQNADHGDLASRLQIVEQDLASLNQNAQHLMDRGQVPPDETKAAEWKTFFANADLSTDTRKLVGTIRLLRSNQLFDDTMAAHAGTLLTQSTNNGVTRALIESLRGIDNVNLKPAFLALANSATDGRVRWNAINGLREFADSDPTVEATLWKIAQNDSSRELRSRAEDALKRIPMTDARQADLAAKVTNTGLDFDERWSAFRVLGNSKEADLSQVALSLVQSSSVAADDESKIAYIRAFDDINHEEFMVPLVNSVQDPSAEVRLRATDALVDYKDKDPNVKEWLKVLMESDPDPRVRKEAARAFQKPQQRRRR